MATDKNHTGIFKKILVDFISQEDPILAMLEWTAQQMIQMEAAARVGVLRGEHSDLFYRSFDKSQFLMPF